MILRALHDLYGRFEVDPAYDVAPLGRSYQKVSFVIVLDHDGSLVGVQDVRQPLGDRKLPRRVLVPGIPKPSGSGLNPCFLWDSSGYLLGWDPDRPERAKRTFEASRQRHLEVEPAVRSEEFSVVCRFLQSWQPERAAELGMLAELGSGFGVFQLRAMPQYVHESQSILAWWDDRTEGDPERMQQWWVPSQPTDGERMQAQCLITGQQAPIARLHPKIKGVKNALPGGATIAGFNAPSYWSYGLTQSFNAPVSDEAAHRYATALSTLLDGPRRDKHRLDVGHTTVAFWTDRPTPIEDIFLVFAAEGSGAVAGSVAQDENVRAKLGAFLAALRRGRENYGEIDHAAETTGYCILGLAAPTQARIAVRFFHHGTLAELLDNLRRHHGDIGIERRFRDTAKRPEPEFPSVRFLLDETCPLKKGRPDRDKIPPLLEATLLQAIVTGGRYPEGLFGAVMRRIAADRIINYARACTIKGYLVRNLGRKAPMTLDLARAEPAYRLGRLFAALDKTQQDALGKVNATIRDRFYASASATPGAVFPRLLRTYQHHLAKLESGQKVNREKLVQEILAPVADIPGHLNLAEQGLFALGYYQQMNAFYTKKENRTDKAGT